ncbi:hypothetical protein F5884DRAFT_785562 [Xylogone sp. PMI_703]|nr:hypothetical protein F5884DRAFT_785562 [Xylogone sp. PMI_703]
MEAAEITPKPRKSLRRKRPLYDADDDWSGVTNPIARRRVQNRLNQRLYRERRKKSAVVPSSSNVVELESEMKKTDDDVPSDMLVVRSTSNTGKTPPQPKITVRPWYTSQSEIAAKFRKLGLSPYLRSNPSADHLLSLIQVNVLRGIEDVVYIIGLTPDVLMSDNTESPFTELGRGQHPERRMIESPPGCLLPTTLQKIIPHHVWIDVLPFPRLRDNILLLESGISPHSPKYDDDALCRWMIGVHPDQKEGGLILWGEPWDPASWEITEDFARHWSWMLSGCWDLFKSTNRWRRKRGEKPISFGSLEGERLVQID